MNPYLAIAQRWPGDEVRRFVQELGAWHDEMVIHQRVMLRLGPQACSETCAHATGRQLWKRATELLGVDANDLTFLRASASQPGQASIAPLRKTRVA